METSKEFKKLQKHIKNLSQIKLSDIKNKYGIRLKANHNPPRQIKSQCVLQIQVFHLK